jgi:hypothetical protein
VIHLLQTGESLPPTSPGRLVCCDFPNLYVVAGYRILDGYVALPPAKSLNYHSAHALQVAQVQYARVGFKQTPQVAGAEPMGRDWLRLPPALPRVRLVTDTRVSRDPSTDLENVDVQRVALTTRELGLPGGMPGTAEMTQDDPGRLHVRTQAGDRQLLVISESYDDGWIAAVDGRQVPLERVNGDFMGCVVPAGSHLVTLEFRPAHLRWGRIISLAAAGFDLVLLVISFV